MEVELAWKKEVRKGSLSLDVRRVQEWLTLHGHPVGTDGDFGPRTHAAVVEFQQARGLETDGIVGPATFEALTAPMRAALASPAALPPREGVSPLASLVVALAKQHLAQHPREVGGPNGGPWVRLYLDGHQGREWPWCAGFATYVVRQAAAALAMPSPVPRTYSCDVMASNAQASGRLLLSPSTTAERLRVGPGCLFLRRRAPNDWDHTGIVLSRQGTTIQTVEGNTNAAGSREGTEVRQRERTLTGLDFVIL